MTGALITLGIIITACWAVIRITNAIEAALDLIAHRDAEHDTIEANDWHEPTRTQVEITWDDIALGRVLAALDETDDLDPMLLPLSHSPAAQRIREQITANHEAEVARLRDALDGWDGAA